MGEHADDWAASGRTNLWGAVPDVIEMQSEAGAAGALHGALQKGALGDDVHRVAGPAADGPEHVQDRRRADADGDPRRGEDGGDPRTLDLRRPLRCDACPNDGMGDAVRQLGAGGARLRAGRARGDASLSRSVPALLRRVPHDATRSTRSRCSTTTTCGRWCATRTSSRFRRRGMTPDAPVVRGSAQNPDVFFQAREACNPFHAAVPGVVQTVFDELAARTGRALLAGRVPRCARCRAGDRCHGFGGRRHDGSGRRARRRWRAGRRGDDPPVPSVPRRGAGGGVAVNVPIDCRARPNQGAGLGGRAALHGCACALNEAMDTDRAAVRGTAPSHRRPLWPVVQGVHAGDGQRRVRRTRVDRPEATLHRGDLRRCHALEPPRR